MTKRKESARHTLFGDLDGMTVAEIREMLAKYPDHARLNVYSEPEYGYGGWTDRECEFFVFTWSESDD